VNGGRRAAAIWSTPFPSPYRDLIEREEPRCALTEVRRAVLAALLAKGER